MKKYLSTLLVALLCVASLLSLFACAGTDGITLGEFQAPVDIHTELQSYYLQVRFNTDYTPDVDTDEVKGIAELSRPDPVKLTWKSGKTHEEYKLEVSENADLTNAQTFYTPQTSYNLYNCKIATKYYWRVSADGEQSAIGTFATASDGPRNLYVDGVTNFRDVGGWMTASGKRMKQGIIYRSARWNASYRLDADGNEVKYEEPDAVVAEITAAGKSVVVGQLGIRTEVDFRLDARNGYPTGAPLVSVVDGVKYVAIPMKGSADMHKANDAQLKQLMELLADSNNYPVVYHCNIGTDRTGMVSYIIGALCGMSEEDLLRDYLFSNFGKIDDVKTPSNTHNAYFGFDGYDGATLQQRAESYLQSIGVSAETYNAIRNNLLAD